MLANEALVERRGEVRKSTILVVEDYILLRIAMSELLRDCGFKVLQAMNGTEAIRVLSREAVDLVCSDINLPGPVSGTDIADWLADHLPDIPIVIASGTVQHRFADEPSRRFLAKPYPVDVLISTVRDLIGHA